MKTYEYSLTIKFRLFFSKVYQTDWSSQESSARLGDAILSLASSLGSSRLSWWSIGLFEWSRWPLASFDEIMWPSSFAPGIAFNQGTSIVGDGSFGWQYGKMDNRNFISWRIIWIPKNMSLFSRGTFFHCRKIRVIRPLTGFDGRQCLPVACHRNSVSNSFKNSSGTWTLHSGLPACSPNFNPIENIWSLWKLFEEVSST